MKPLGLKVWQLREGLCGLKIWSGDVDIHQIIISLIMSLVYRVGVGKTYGLGPTPGAEMEETLACLAHTFTLISHLSLILLCPFENISIIRFSGALFSLNSS